MLGTSPRASVRLTILSVFVALVAPGWVHAAQGPRDPPPAESLPDPAGQVVQVDGTGSDPQPKLESKSGDGRPRPAVTTPPPDEPPPRRSRALHSVRIPAAGKFQPWLRYTLFTEYYRENYNTFQSDDGFVGLVNRLNLGGDARLDKVSLGGQIRVDTQNIFFPSGRNCTETECLNLQDDYRLERTTFRLDTRRFGFILGDYNVSLSRGLALSVRKIDEIGVDTTIKGARFDVRTKPFRASVSGGFSNRQNSDFATRQLLPDPGFPAKTYFNRPVDEGLCRTDRMLDPEIGSPIWTTCSDLVLAGRAEGTLPGRVDLGGHYVLIDFGDETSALFEDIDETLHMVGGDIARARIAKTWDTFFGGSALLRNPNLRGTQLSESAYNGYALYTANTLGFGTTTVLLEGKHYVDWLSGITQNSFVQYSEAPTLEREDQQVPGNINASGGRIRLDHTIRKLGLTLTVNSMQYIFAENQGFRSWGGDGLIASHNYGGIIYRKPDSDFVLILSGGYRHEQWLENQPGLGRPVRRKFPHGEYAVSFPVGAKGGFSHALSFRGEGRWETYQEMDQFFRGLFVFSWSMAPYLSVSFLQGVDTERPAPPGELSLTDEQCLSEDEDGEGPAEGSRCRPHLWPGGEVRVTFLDASFVRIFAGRQVGGRVCVNGSCRILPDFEGVRAELTLSF